MNTSKWQTIILIVVSCLALAEAVFIFRVYARLNGAEKKISRMGDLVAELSYESKGEREEEKQTGEQSRLERLERQLQALSLQVSTFRTQDLAETNIDENLDNLVERKLGEKMVEAMGSFRGPLAEKQKFALISKQVSLTERQQTEVQDSLARIHQGIVELAEEARENDPAFLKGLDKIMKAPMPRKQRLRRIRRHLATNKRPNKDETYLDAVVQLRRQSIDEISATLTPEQIQELKAMKLLPNEND